MEKPKQEKKEIEKPQRENIFTQPFRGNQYVKAPKKQDLTKGSTGFSPTRKMIKWFDTTAEMGFSASFTDIAEKSKVSRGSWYIWIQDPEFVKWWDFRWQELLHHERWKLDAIGMKMAKTNYNYWKDMMNRAGNTIPEQGNQIQVNQQFNLPDANLERITRKD